MRLEIVVAIIGVAGAIIAGLIPIILQHNKEKKKEKKLRKIIIRKINNTNDTDVTIALRLFERRIPEEERDSSENIIRWLREIQDETTRGVCKLIDFFLVAKIHDEVAGFAYVQFYPRFSFAFFSYLVVDDRIPEARECHVSTRLLREISNYLFKGNLNCKGIVVEVEEPKVLKAKQKSEAEARIRHFQTLSRQLGFPLKSVSINYTQPRLSNDDKMQEYKMRLMYAIKNPSIEPRRITKRETIEIIQFLAEEIYGDHFEHQADLDQKYRKYLKSWSENHINKLTDVVELF